MGVGKGCGGGEQPDWNSGGHSGYRWESEIHFFSRLSLHTYGHRLFGVISQKHRFLCGQSYRSLTNRQIREQIAYVPQEPYLFQGSVLENIHIGKLDATDEEVVQAAKLAYAHDFIEKLENGYNTEVGERGNRLSGGQRQRIAIARAILKEDPVILLDEATSALDNESEQLVNEALKGLHGQRTLLMIAHRPSTIALADRTQVMPQL